MLVALHTYTPLSSTEIELIVSTAMPSGLMVVSGLLLLKETPSFIHVTTGRGTPVTTHSSLSVSPANGLVGSIAVETIAGRAKVNRTFIMCVGIKSCHVVMCLLNNYINIPRMHHASSTNVALLQYKLHSQQNSKDERIKLGDPITSQE